MQQQQQLQELRQQNNSSRAYSPEYSSPFSSQSLLQARFSQVSPTTRVDGKNGGAPSRYTKRSKENYIEAPLPVFQENSSNTLMAGQMIAQVTVAADSEKSEIGRAILSDMSDEMLIKQLQLNMNGEKHSSIGFQSSSALNSMNNALCEAKSNSFIPNCSNKDALLMTNQHSPQKSSIFTAETKMVKQISSEIHKKQRVSSIKQKKASVDNMKQSTKSNTNNGNQPQNHNSGLKHQFVTGKTQSHTWANASAAGNKTTASQHHTRASKQLRSNHSKKKQSTANSIESGNIIQVNEVPVPHPYPVQQHLFSKDDDHVITDTFNPQQHLLMQKQQQSPEASGEQSYDVIGSETHQKFIEMQQTSENKLDKLVTWSSASPAPATPQISAPAFRTDFGQSNFPQQMEGTGTILQQHHLGNNETIPEQPTEEQLQASSSRLAAQHPTITVVNQDASSSMGQLTPFTQGPPVQEPQILLTAAEMLQLSANLQQMGGLDSVSALEAVAHRISSSAERSESESIKQIRMINQLMQKKFTTNYSPDRCSMDASDSLKDFSVGVVAGSETHRGPIPASSTPNDDFYKNQINPPTSSAYLTSKQMQQMLNMADLNENNLLKLPCDVKLQQQPMQREESELNNNESMVGLKDSFSTCQNIRQQAIPHTIHANLLQQQIMDEETSQYQSGHILPKEGDSTLLNTNEKSHASINARQFTAGEQAAHQRQTQQPQTTQAQLRPGSTRQQHQATGTSLRSSPKRTAIYGLCQNPSEELYKPILRNGATSGSKAHRASTESMPGALRLSSQAINYKATTQQANGPYSGAPSMPENINTKTTTPTKPNFVSPSTSAAPVVFKRCDSRRPVRRKLEPHLASKKQSLSPVSRQDKPKLVKSGGFGTMISKYAGKTRHGVQSSRSKDTAKSSQGKSARLSLDSHHIANNVQRTRNGENTHFPVSRSLVDSKEKETGARRGSVERQSTNFGQNNFASLTSLASSSVAVVRASKMMNKVDQAQTLAVDLASTKSPVPRTQTVSLTASTSQRTIVENPKVAPAQRTQKSLTPQQTRSSMYQLRRASDAVKTLEVQMFLEFARIKKPSAAILAIARMSCLFFEAIRTKDQHMMDQVESMQSWQQIQEYMRTNLTCCVSELKNILKLKILQHGRPAVQDPEACSTVVDQQTSSIDFASMEKIWETFFIESKIRVIRRFMQTNKLMKGLVQLIYAFICLTLNLEREFNYDNLLGLTEQPTTKAEEIKLLFSATNSGVSCQQNQSGFGAAPASLAQKYDSLQQEQLQPRQLSQEPSKPPSIERSDQNSYCSKCSCELSSAAANAGAGVQQQQPQQSSSHHLVKQQQRMSRRSRLMLMENHQRDANSSSREHSSGEVVDVHIKKSSGGDSISSQKKTSTYQETAGKKSQSQKQQREQQQADIVDMAQMNMFKTLDQVYVEQHNYTSKNQQQMVGSKLQQQQQKQKEVMSCADSKVDNNFSARNHRPGSKSVRSVNTSSERRQKQDQTGVPGAKEQIQNSNAMPEMNNACIDPATGKNMMKVMDDYEAPADENQTYGPFTKKAINADLNTNIAEQVVIEASKNQSQAARIAPQKQTASIGRSAAKVAGYMAATHSSNLQKNTLPINNNRRRARDNTTHSSGSDFVSVVRASVGMNTNTATTTANVMHQEKNQRSTPKARNIQPQAQIQPQITAMTSRQRQVSSNQLKYQSMRGATRGKDVSPASRPLSKTASSRNISQKKFQTIQQNQTKPQKVQANTIAATQNADQMPQSRHVRTSTLYKSTASVTAKINRPSKSPLNRDSSVKSFRRMSFGTTSTSTGKQPINSGQAPVSSTCLKSRKTKSQANLKVLTTHCKRTTPVNVTPKQQHAMSQYETERENRAEKDHHQICTSVNVMPSYQPYQGYRSAYAAIAPTGGSSSERDTLFQMQAQYLNEHNLREAKRNIAQRNLEALRPKVNQIRADQIVLQPQQQQNLKERSRNPDVRQDCHLQEHEMSFKRQETVIHVKQMTNTSSEMDLEKQQEKLGQQKSNGKKTVVKGEQKQHADIEIMHSFGGDVQQQQTEDMRRHSLGIHEEQSSQGQILLTRRTDKAPKQEPSFTPEKQSDDDSIFQAKPDVYNGSSKAPPEASDNSISDRVEFNSVRQCEPQQSNSIEEPTCTLNDSVLNAERACFILQKAQDITENINSCYKTTHNMPQINMATIEKLKMRRMHIKKEGCTDLIEQQELPQMQMQQQQTQVVVQNNLEVTPRSEQQDPRRMMPFMMPILKAVGSNNSCKSTTQQSCNVMTTQTEMIETANSLEKEHSSFGADQAEKSSGQYTTGKQELNFTEALNNLKAEVEILMKTRIQQPSTSDLDNVFQK